MRTKVNKADVSRSVHTPNDAEGNWCILLDWKPLDKEFWRFDDRPFWGVVRKLHHTEVRGMMTKPWPWMWKWTVGIRGFQMEGMAKTRGAAKNQARRAIVNVLEELAAKERKEHKETRHEQCR